MCRPSPEPSEQIDQGTKLESSSDSAGTDTTVIAAGADAGAVPVAVPASSNNNISTAITAATTEPVAAFASTNSNSNDVTITKNTTVTVTCTNSTMSDNKIDMSLLVTPRIDQRATWQQRNFHLLSPPPAPGGNGGGGGCCTYSDDHDDDYLSSIGSYNYSATAARRVVGGGSCDEEIRRGVQHADDVDEQRQLSSNTRDDSDRSSYNGSNHENDKDISNIILKFPLSLQQQSQTSQQHDYHTNNNNINNNDQNCMFMTPVNQIIGGGNYNSLRRRANSFDCIPYPKILLRPRFTRHFNHDHNSNYFTTTEEEQGENSFTPSFSKSHRRSHTYNGRDNSTTFSFDNIFSSLQQQDTTQTTTDIETQQQQQQGPIQLSSSSSFHHQRPPSLPSIPSGLNLSILCPPSPQPPNKKSSLIQPRSSTTTATIASASSSSGATTAISRPIPRKLPSPPLQPTPSGVGESVGVVVAPQPIPSETNITSCALSLSSHSAFETPSRYYGKTSNHKSNVSSSSSSASLSSSSSSSSSFVGNGSSEDQVSMKTRRKDVSRIMNFASHLNHLPNRPSNLNQDGNDTGSSNNNGIVLPPSPPFNVVHLHDSQFLTDLTTSVNNNNDHNCDTDDPIYDDPYDPEVKMKKDGK